MEKAGRPQAAGPAGFEGRRDSTTFAGAGQSATSDDAAPALRRLRRARRTPATALISNAFYGG